MHLHVVHCEIFDVKLWNINEIYNNDCCKEKKSCYEGLDGVTLIKDQRSYCFSGRTSKKYCKKEL